jgi:adenosylcobinamide kinase / adenosylcobinamide-phosphate guanylyltransferase
MHELLLGGQKSGKSRCAEARAAAWLAADAAHEATLIATAHAGDDDMAARIARHRADRARRVPGLATLEVPSALPEAIAAQSAPHRLLVVDCLTLWLTQALMPPPGWPAGAPGWPVQEAALLQALRAAPGPVVLVSNEIALGVIPLDPTLRRFLDTLGLLHQRVADGCSRVTLMVAGIALPVKRA